MATPATPDWRADARRLIETPAPRAATVVTTAPSHVAGVAGLGSDNATVASSDVENFLAAVLPDATVGEFCVQLIPSKSTQRTPAARWTKTHTDTARVVLELDATRLGAVYVAIGSFTGRRRKAENTATKRALYLDLDCGEGKPYATKEAAAEDVERFCEASGLPAPNVVVDSGNGLHCYWTFDRDVTLAEWQRLASALKTSCEQHELHADPSVTADAARILRMPGTWNRKSPANPKLVKLLRCEAVLSVEQIEAALAPTPSGAALILAGTVGDELSTGQHSTAWFEALAETDRAAEARAMLTALPDSAADERDEWISVLAEVSSLTLPWEARVDLGWEFSQRSAKSENETRESIERTMRGLGERTSVNALAKRAAEHGYVRSIPTPATPIQIGPGVPALPLAQAKNGQVLASKANLRIALSSAEFLGEEIRLATFRDEIMVAPLGTEEWRPFDDTDYFRLCSEMEQKKAFGAISRESMRDAVAFVAKAAQFDSAVLWIESLSWDGTPRVERFLADYFNAPDTAYTQAVARYVWTAMAGRVLCAGCKADMVPVLVGPQGCGKSSGVAAMVPDPNHYAEIDLMLRDADQSRKIRGKLVGEIAELRGLAGREQEAVKAFITRQFEEWTPKYREFNVKFPRRLVFIGTTNQDEFLFDETGHRRWLPVKVGRVDVAGIERDRLHMWAEARDLFKAGGIAYANAERLARTEHAAHYAEDVWQPSIEQWLDGMAINGKRRGDGTFSIADLLVGALGTPVGHLTTREQMRAGRILRHLGYEKKVVKVGGVAQKLWMRKKVVP